MIENNLVIELSEYGDSLGPREIGKEIRERVLSNLHKSEGVLFSFKNVHVISSGFADELFGKLFEELGEVRFKKIVKLNNFDNINDRDLVIKVIKNSLSFRKKQTM